MKSWAFCIIVVSMVAAGCSGVEPATAVPVAYAEPGWMAEVRAQDEEYAQAGVACMRAAGYDAFVSSGSFAVISHFDPVTNPGADADLTAAMDRCGDEAPSQAYLSNSPDVEYDRVLDLRACLVNQGYTMPEAPSREVWTEAFRSGDGSPWSPYLNEFENNPAADAPHPYTVAEIDRLQSACTPSMSGGITAYRE